MTRPAVFAQVLVYLLFLVTVVDAQQSQPSTTPGTTLSTTTELVLVPVQVKGSDGKPVLSLKQKDFVLRSDKQIQPVAVFEELRTSSAKAAPPVQPAAADFGKFFSVPPGGMPQQLVIIAIDLVNTPFLEQGRARQQLIKYLSEDLPSQPFAVVAITKDGLQQVHSFSSDPKVLADALRRLQSETGKEEAQETPVDITGNNDYADLENAFRETQLYGSYITKIAARATLTALQQIAQAYAGVPGRKSVIWLTAGIPTLLIDALAGGAHGSATLNADTELLPDYERTFDALNTANIAIYGIDLKGLKDDKTYRGTGLNQMMYNPARDPHRLYGGNTVRMTDAQDDGIKVLAAATGGKTCTAMTELKTCINEALADNDSYYLLGFYVPQQDRRPGWHKLEVKLASGKGTVHARSSYYLAPRNPPSEKQLAASIRDAAAAKIGYTGFAFAIQTVTDPSQGAEFTKFKIMVPATSVLLSSGDQQNLSYDVAMVPLSAKGDLLKDIRVTHLNLTPQQTQTALLKGWMFTEPGLPPGSAAAVKFVIRDDGTGRIGSVIVPMPKPPTKG